MQKLKKKKQKEKDVLTKLNNTLKIVLVKLKKKPDKRLKKNIKCIA